MKIGIQELLVIFIVALVVVGPDKLLYYAKKLGEALGQFRKYTDAATKEIRESVVEPLEEAQRPLREAMEPVTELEKTVRTNMNDITKSINSIGKPVKEEKPSADTTVENNKEASEQEEAPAEDISQEQPTEALDADSAEAAETA